MYLYIYPSKTILLKSSKSNSLKNKGVVLGFFKFVISYTINCIPILTLVLLTQWSDNSSSIAPLEAWNNICTSLVKRFTIVLIFKSFNHITKQHFENRLTVKSIATTGWICSPPLMKSNREYCISILKRNNKPSLQSLIMFTN